MSYFFIIEFKFVHEVCIIKKNKQRQIYIIFPPLLLLKPTDKCARAMQRAKRSKQKGSTFKEDDRALPI